MSTGRISVLLLTILVLNLEVAACGFTSQGPQEQKDPQKIKTPPKKTPKSRV